jgi:carbamoyltransferase
MWVLGINAPPLGWHDAAAALVDGDGVVHALVEEERVTRHKHALRAYPRNAARECLAIAGITPADVDIVAIGWDLPRHSARTDLVALDPPVLGRPWEFGDSRDFLIAAVGWDLDLSRYLELVCVSHHLAHAAASFYASGYDAAAVLVVDGHGDDESVSIYDARQGQALIRRERWPITSSPGYMYDSVSELIGLTSLEAGKTMGLAAHGQAREVEPWPMFDITGDAFTPPFSLPPNATQKEIAYGWWDHIRALGFRRAHTNSYDLDRDDDAVRLAWSTQYSLQQVMTLLAERARRLTNHDSLCLSGGVALNCSANGLLPQPVYVPPVPHDAGVALGAAWTVATPRYTGNPLSPYLGRAISTAEINAAVAEHGLAAHPVSADDIAQRLLAGEIGAVVTGRAEVGPRALCHRSIIAAAHDVSVRDHLNQIKGRELWRPLCPAGLAQCEDQYWEGNATLHRYMVGASEVTELGHKEIPATVHVDGTARPQIITDRSELMWSVLDRMRAAGAPAATINTSFNMRGEPIVDNARGALASARSIGLDFVVFDDRVVELTDSRSAQTGG